MFSESVVELFGPKSTASAASRVEQECQFWSRTDGHVNVQHFRPSESASYGPHTHSEYTIVICLAGAVSKTQLGTTHVIEAGEAMIGNFGVEHASAYFLENKGCEVVCVTVDRRLLANLLKDAELPAPKGARHPVFLGKLRSRVLYACALDMAQELPRRDLGHTIVVEGLALRMVVEAVRAWPRSRVTPCEVDLTPRLPRRDFVRAYEFMRWCRKDEFRLKNLCGFLGSSEERFARLFHAATNASPAHFYNRMLLERGRELLRDRRLSVKEVGYLLGFKTSSHFAAAFGKHFGSTPVEYRNGCSHIPADLADLA
ncbi:MAG: helix-turn-helix domain-containing protein [Deltaproteobacteria bacterium]|nr:helix-turn-helix domain-containing protein [Deltaproteobacteria bacterium]